MKKNLLSFGTFGTCFLGILLAISLSNSVFANSGVYAGGPVYIHRDYSINELKNSGFTYVIVWTIHMDANGDMNLNGEFPLVSNGNYIGNARYPNFPADIASLKQGATSINRVELSLSGWGSGTFRSIRDLVNSQGTGTNSILYRNFKALKDAIPSVDAINFDDESEYDVDTATRFAVMLADIGYKISLVPYTRAEFWTSLTRNTNAQRPGAVDRIDLQVYAGGGGNNPCNWDFGNVPIYPGMWSNEASPAQVQSRMGDWKNACANKVKGGFMWLYDDFDNSTRVQDYSGAINAVFPQVNTPQPAPALRAFGDCSKGGWQAQIPAGQHDLSFLRGLGFINDEMSSLEVSPGWQVQLFMDAGWSGQQVNAEGSVNCLVDLGINDNVSSLNIVPRGDTGLTGRYYLRNRKSGMYMDLANGSSDDGANILQWHFHGGANQQFDFQHLGDGVYVIRSAVSQKALDVAGINVANGANVFQWQYFGSDNQKFILHREGDYHQLVALHSNRVVEVSNGSMEADANIQQWDNNRQTTSYWELVPVGTNDNKLDLQIEAETYSNSSGVAREVTTDAGGGENVGWINSGSWMVFSDITIPEAGTYTVEYRIASPNDGTQLGLDINAGAQVLGTVNLPNTGGWQSWTTVSHEVQLPAGTHNFGVFAPTGGWNINWLHIRG